MPEAVYKDTPNNRKLGRVGEKFGDPKFKTTRKAPAPKKVDAPKKEPAPKKVAAPKKAEPNTNPNLLTKQSVDFLRTYWKYAGSDTKPPFKYIDLDEQWDFNKTSSNYYEDKFEYYMNNTGILTEVFVGVDEDDEITPIYEPSLEELQPHLEKLEDVLEKNLQLKDLGPNDQKMILAVERLKPKPKKAPKPKKEPAPKKAPAPAPAPAPPIVMPYVHINPAVDFMISQKGPGSMPIKNFGSAVKPVLKKKSVGKPKSILEIQKQKDKDKLKSFKQYQNYVQLL